MTEQLSEHFTMAELACPMNGEVLLEDGFLHLLEDLRKGYGHPMIVTSGCRSVEHNDWLIRRGYQASPHSFHLTRNNRYTSIMRPREPLRTCAVDIARPDARTLWYLLQKAADRLWSIGIGKTFIHLDARAKLALDTGDRPITPVVYTY